MDTYNLDGSQWCPAINLTQVFFLIVMCIILQGDVPCPSMPGKAPYGDTSPAQIGTEK